MLPKRAKRGRPPIDQRRIVDAVLYVVKCGCPWHYHPTDFPAWQSVCHGFRQWTLNHQWAVLNDVPRTLVRKTHGKRSTIIGSFPDSLSCDFVLNLTIP